MRTGLQRIVCAWGLLLFGQTVYASDEPSVHASAHSGSTLRDASISVRATAEVGLDSIAITWPEGDLRYDTQLSRSAIDRSFQRSFLLPDVFPDAVNRNDSLRIIVTARNTRGETASTAVLVQPHAPKER